MSEQSNPAHLIFGRLTWESIPLHEPILIATFAMVVLGGLVAILIVNLVRRRFIAVGAARHRARVVKELRAAVAEAADERAVAPLRAELDTHAKLADLLRTAAGRPG